MKKALCFVAVLAVTMMSAPNANADLILRGLVDGGLTGGIPKAIIIEAEAAIADLSIYGAGSANNAGGTDGEEVTFAGSAAAGDFIIVASNQDTADFFTNCFEGLTVVINGPAAGINGDDSIELFQNGAVIDQYGVVGVDGTGENWEYLDSVAVRTDDTKDGTFDVNRWTIDPLNSTDGLDENGHKSLMAARFGFTVVPEPGSALFLGGLGLVALARRRK